MVVFNYVHVGIGPVTCRDPFFSGSVATFVLLGIILLVDGVCLLESFCQGDEKNTIRTFLYCIAGFLGIAFLVVVAVQSFYAFLPTFLKSYTGFTSSECSYTLSVLATTCFSYLLISFFCCCWFFCLYLLLKTAK